MRYFGHFRFFSLFAITLLLLAIPAPAADVVWTNTAGGNWSAPTNWNAGLVPGPDDNVFITNAGNYTVSLDVGATVTNLTLGGVTGTQTLALVSTTLTLTGTGTVASNAV